jgi:ABC-type phosphate/phosphonate transport system substrate-binding protein
MNLLPSWLRQPRWRFLVLAFALPALVAFSGVEAGARQAKIDVLHVGTSGTLTAEKDTSKEKGALETLRNFIKEETGFANDIVRQKDWRELADKMAKSQLHVGVFQGYEFAWAQEQNGDLKPLALAVNVYRYPVAYMVAKKDDPAKDFAGLKGQSLCLPDTGQRYLRLFVDRESQAAGKEAKDFFSKVTTRDNVEDVLDDVVDGVVQAAAVDRASLEAYKRRKPGRFNQLKEVAHSQPFPPVVVAYYDKVLDEATLRRFREGLLGASNKEKGKMMLTLFRLSGFDAPPEDFAKVLAETRKAYPPPKGEKTTESK